MKRLEIPPLVLGVALLSVGLFTFSVFVMAGKQPIGEPEAEAAPDTLTELELIEDAYYSDAQWWKDSMDMVIYHDMAKAFIEVESKGSTSALNRAENSAGPLQIRPIMVAEANRVRPEGTPEFTLDDRWSREKSIEIFVTIMMEKLEVPDIAAACEVWNPGCGEKYRMAVAETYMQLELAE